MSCPDCFKGFERTDATPTGSISTVYGLPTYIAKPPASTPAKGIIVFIPDAFGWEFINNRLLVDSYAASGFLVYLPDFMAGVPAPLYMLESLERLTKPKSWWDTLLKPYDLFWTARGMVPFIWYNWPSTSFPRVAAFLEKLRTSGPSHEGVEVSGGKGLKIGAAGFCWGGKHCLTLTRKENAHLIDSVYTAHPSMLALPGDIEMARKPVSIAVGDKDNMMSKEQAKEAERVLKKLEGEVEGMKGEVVVYEGAAHGFSVRIDRHNEKQVEQSVQAEKQALRWFEETLK